MPDKRPSVKNEDQYEALKEKGVSKERAGRIADPPRSIQPWRQEVGLWCAPTDHEPGWNDGSEGSGRPQGRPGYRAEELSVSPRDRIAVVRVTPEGPLLVRGPVRLIDEEGREVLARRRVNALCRCGRSAVQPFCDGTHKIVPFSPRAVNGASASGPGVGSPPGG